MRRGIRHKLAGIVIVEGISYQWKIHTEPGIYHYPVKTLRGLVVAVEPIDSPKRSLLVEYPFAHGFNVSCDANKYKPRVSAKDLALRISQAMEAGWDPFSKGKPFLFEVPRVKGD